MTDTRRVVFVLYDGFELLDLAGPAGVFSMANTVAGRALYELVHASVRGGEVRSGGGAVVGTRPLRGVRLGPRDTAIIVGAEAAPLAAALVAPDLVPALRRASARAGRVASVCTGAFLLASTGVLDGRSATTHWEGTDAFRARFPAVKLHADALYVVEGRVWTSAGVATGIDMALAMLARDHGEVLMGRVARRLVVYAHRPGGQSQFSATLEGQLAATRSFASVVRHIERDLSAPLDVARLARIAGMSERSFFRRFRAAVGVTPARFVETMRIERAKRLLEKGASVDEVAAAVGYRSAGRLRGAFQSRLGVSPSSYRSHQATARGEEPRASRHRARNSP